MIRKVGKHYELRSKDGSKLLGKHPSRASALRQERVIEMHKHMNDQAKNYFGGDDDEDRDDSEGAEHEGDEPLAQAPEGDEDETELDSEGAEHPDKPLEQMPTRKSYADVIHIDAISSGHKFEKMENGWLKADALIARTGIQEYVMPDGTVRRELRKPEEVFNKDSLKSFEMVPITNEHPPSMRLTSDNTRSQQIGTLGESVEKHGDFVKAKILITDADAVRQILSGSKVGLSCGYEADCTPEQGEWNGMKYDSVQKNIRGNHVALTATPRGGPDLRVRMDSGASEKVVVE